MKNSGFCVAVFAMATFGFSSSLWADVTFSKEVAPIIFQNCTKCHRPGEAAPFSLQTYEDVRKRGELISHVVETGLMPPWKPAGGDVAFRHDRRLSSEQIQTIRAWVQGGMPEGNAAELPSLPKFTPGWSLGEPDLVVSMKDAYSVPAEGPDVYRNFVVPLNLRTDVWVTAIDFRPSARAVVHHCLFFYDTTGGARKAEDEDAEPGFKGGMGALSRFRKGANDGLSGPRPLAGARRGMAGGRAEAGEPASFGVLGGWALGAQPQTLPDGLAFYLPAGSDLILSTHFHPSGKAEAEKSTVGLYFSKEPPKRRFTGIQLPPMFGALKGIDIAPGTKDYTIEESFELPVDVKAFGVGSHAHYLGKTIQLTATLPDGTQKVLLNIPDWDFAWQERYLFDDYVALPKGTRLHAKITYDNSADNPRNPSNPPARVQFGEESTDEMGAISLLVVPKNDDELPELTDAYRDFVRTSFTKAPVLKLLQNRRRAK